PPHRPSWRRRDQPGRCERCADPRGGRAGDGPFHAGSMTRLLYALAWLLATPFVILRLAWRARRQPGYLYRVSERFGRYGAAAPVSERSARRYRRVRSLSAWAFENLAGVAAQTAADARRLESIGARPVSVLGNVKFDLAVPAQSVALAAAFRENFGAHRVVWL